MTQSIRTISQITAAIDVAVKVIEDVDTFIHELRVAAMKPFDGFVVGYDWGMFLAAGYSDRLGGVLCARKFGSRTVARDFIVVNGKGEQARVMPHAEALKISIALQETHRETVVDMLLDLQHELGEAYEAEREATAAWAAEERAIAREIEANEAKAMADEALERAADEASYYDSFRERIEVAYEDERRRKGGWSLRAAAARIADSSSEYEG